MYRYIYIFVGGGDAIAMDLRQPTPSKKRRQAASRDGSPVSPESKRPHT